MEKSYEEVRNLYSSMQDEWVEENLIREFKTKVRVLRKAKGNELGWGNSWVEPMDKFVGQTATVIGLDSSGGVYLDDGNESWQFPFFALEVVVPESTCAEEEVKEW